MRSVTLPPFRIFLSYRREDSQDAAGRLYDQLAVEFGEDHVFLDVDAIPAGVDFVDHINEAVGRADVFVTLIGRGWLDAADKSGRRRLDDEGDFVRLELEAALARGIPVIPTLVQSTAPPAAADLPESLTKLARIQAQTLSHERWRYDSGRLITRLKEIESEKASRLGVKATPRAKSPRTQVPSQASGAHAEAGGAEIRPETHLLLRRYGPSRGSTIVAFLCYGIALLGFVIAGSSSGNRADTAIFITVVAFAVGVIVDWVTHFLRPRKR